jgi:diaminohydroxyphosphoribosylaminopyrimidine deaminase / 5-amino-6-(5-phosphoribosylamino)uracil reductase
MRLGRPWVRLKLAMSLDGRTALANGESRWITAEAARADVQRWRARSSAVLTGVGTVLADDPRLDVRVAAERPAGPPSESAATRARVRQPVRVVLDSALRTPPAARLFEAAGPVWIFTRSGDPGRRAALEARGARIEQLDPAGSHAAGGHAAQSRLPLAAVLERLAAAGMNEVLVEAGATLAGALLHEQRVDELLLYIAPVLLGPEGRSLAQLPQPAELARAPRFALLSSEQIGADLRLQLRPLASE